jgi:anti-anti-sigma factor
VKTATRANAATAHSIELHGEYDLSRKDELNELLAALPRDEAATIDLRGVTYADSTFLAALATLALRFQGVVITIMCPQPQILRVLKIVNFDKLFRIVNRD